MIFVFLLIGAVFVADNCKSQLAISIRHKVPQSLKDKPSMRHWLSIATALIFFGISPLGHAQQADTTGILDTFHVKADDPIAMTLDSVWSAYLFQNDDFTTDRNALNVHGFAKDSIPYYSDSVYSARFAQMNAESPFAYRYNEAVKGYLQLYLKRRRSYTSRLLGLSEMYYPMFEEMLDKYDMPLEIKHLAIVESGLKPVAKSRAGAVGLWQFMYPTGRMLGLQVTSYVDERRDPFKATEAACQYLRYLHSIYHDWDLALAAYNAGPGNVNKAIRRAGGGPKTYWEIRSYLPRETQGYVPAFYSVCYMMRYPSEHNIYPKKPDLQYFDYDTIHITEGVTFDQLAAVLCIEREMIERLNPMYKMGVIPQPLPGQKYVLALPKGSVGLFLMNEVYIYNYKQRYQEIDEELVVRERKTHIVVAGENLGKVARKHGCTVEELRIWNNLRKTTIQPGQQLLVFSVVTAPTTASVNNKEGVSDEAPNSSQSTSMGSDYVYHTVQSGDTLWSIAKANGLTVEQIRELNKNINENNLHRGQKIKIGVKG